MDFAPLADLDTLDRDALLALLLSSQEKLAALTATRDAELHLLLAELDSHRHGLAEQADELRSRSKHIEHLELMVDQLRHMLFGAKSEKVALKLEQFELELEEMETTQAEAESALDQVLPTQEPKASTARKPLPEHLPREIAPHAPDRNSCQDCGSQLRQFGEDISPNSLSMSQRTSSRGPHGQIFVRGWKVIRHVRPKLCCSGCDRVVQVPAPSRPIERGLAGPGLMAHVIVSKFSDHLPLYR
jgi:transposase